MTEDDVDRITANWARVRPDLDTSALHTFSRISRIAHHLEQVRREAFAVHGLDPWEFDVLSALRRSGEPFTLTPGALMQETLVTSGTMTSRVEKLTARGLVSRSRAPGDGRSVAVTLSTRGLEIVDAALAALVQRENELMNHVDAGDQTALIAGLRRLLLSIEGGFDPS